jgi:superfamily I DNA/RNA helicase
MKNLSDEQIKIIQSNDKYIKIQSLSGYGKTSTLIEKCIWHIKQSREKLKILYLVYDENIKDSISQDIKKHFRRHFGRLKLKNKLSCIDIKTTYEFAKDIATDKIGDFSCQNISDELLGDFLYTKLNIKYKIQDIAKIQDVLYRYYNSTDTLLSMIEEELSVIYDIKDKQYIAYIYHAITTIVKHQNELEFTISEEVCLKLASCIDIDDRYFDIVVIDEGSDTNPLILDMFLNINSNIKLIASDNMAKMYDNTKSINAFFVENNFISYILSSSFRIPSNNTHLINEVLSKISSKIHILGNNKKCISDVEVLKKYHLTYIYRYDYNLIVKLYKECVSGNKVYFYGDFVQIYQEFITMCYIYTSDDRFLDMGIDIKYLSQIFVQYDSLIEYIQVSKNTTHIKYYDLIYKWSKTNTSLFDRINIILTNLQEKVAKAQSSYTNVYNAKSREFDYVYISNDFINIDDIVENDVSDISELRLLYIAISRCKNGMYIEPRK